MKEKLQFFAEGGKEHTVYTITEIQDNGHKIQISMEPNRIRLEIPSYAGAFYKFDDALDLTDVSME